MIFPSSLSNGVNPISHLLSNTAGISLPIGYNGTPINYRDSSWLKINVCDMFLKNMCPNVDNCSLAHPPNNVKFESNKVTVCYDYIKKKDCKHSNCKYYHPHDALASAILRRGDDTKKNGNSLTNLGLTMGIQSPFQMSRSQDLYNSHSQNLLSSQLNGPLLADSQMKAKLEIMRQINSVSAQPAWIPGLNAVNSRQLISSSIPPNISLHSFIPGVSAKTSPFNQFCPMLPSPISPVRPAIVGVADHSLTLTGIKRAASESFGSEPNSSHVCASSNNEIYGVPEVKREKHTDPELNNGDTYVDPAMTSQYYTVNTAKDHQQQSPQTHMPMMNGTCIPSNMTIIQANPLENSSLTGYHQLGSFNVNNLLLQALLTNNQNVINPHLEAQLALTGQKIYAPISTFPQVNLGQFPLINQLYYQSLLQNSFNGAPQQLFYPGSVNLSDIQQQTSESTSVAFINDKGTILETLPVCKDFLQGKCKRNQTCSYVHLLDANVEIKDSKLTVCKNAIKGQCNRPVCKFYHIPSHQLQRLGVLNQI